MYIIYAKKSGSGLETVKGGNNEFASWVTEYEYECVVDALKDAVVPKEASSFKARTKRTAPTGAQAAFGGDARISLSSKRRIRMSDEVT